MRLEEINKDQALTILLIILVLAGLLVLPIALQHLYNIDAVTTAFGVIVIYALINWYMKNRD